MSEGRFESVDWGKIIEGVFGVNAEMIFRYVEAHKHGVDSGFPCKPGDTLYEIGDFYKDSTEGILEYTCSCIDVVDNGSSLIPVAMAYRPSGNNIGSAVFTKEQFGEKVFCSKSEAELIFKARKTEIENKIKIVNQIFSERPLKNRMYC